MANYVAVFTYDDTNQIRNILPKPANTPSSGNDYVAADGTYKPIPSVTSGAILAALGYTPANDANVLHTTGNESKTGNLTLAGTLIFDATYEAVTSGLSGSNAHIGMTYRGTVKAGAFGSASNGFGAGQVALGTITGTSISPQAYILPNTNGIQVTQGDRTTLGTISSGAATFSGNAQIINPSTATEYGLFGWVSNELLIGAQYTGTNNYRGVKLISPANPAQNYIRISENQGIDLNWGGGLGRVQLANSGVIVTGTSTFSTTAGSTVAKFQDTGATRGVEIVTGSSQGATINFIQNSSQSYISVASAVQLTFQGTSMRLGVPLYVNQQIIAGTDNGSTAQGAVTIRGGNSGNLNTNGGQIAIYGGTGNGTGVAGNVVIAHTGSATRGKVLIGTSTEIESSVLQVSGNIYASNLFVAGNGFYTNVNGTALTVTNSSALAFDIWSSGRLRGMGGAGLQFEVYDKVAFKNISSGDANITAGAATFSGNITQAGGSILGPSIIATNGFYVGSYQGYLTYAGSGSTSSMDARVYTGGFRVRNDTNTGDGPFSAGAASFSDNVTIAETKGLNFGAGSQQFRANGTNYHSWWTQGTEKYGWYLDRFSLSLNSKIGFSATTVGGDDVYLARNATGPMAQIQAAGGLVVTNLAGSATYGRIYSSNIDLPQQGSAWSNLRFTSSGVDRAALSFDPSRLSVGFMNQSYSANDIGFWYASDGSINLRDAATYNSAAVFTVTKTGAATFSGTITMSGAFGIGSGNGLGGPITASNLNMVIGTNNSVYTNGNRIAVFGHGNTHNSGVSSSYQTIIGSANNVSPVATIANTHVFGSSNTVTATNSITIGNSITNSTANTIQIGVSDSAKMILDSVGAATFSNLLRTTSDKIQIDTSKTPSSSSDTGVLGQICWDSNYIYVCVGTNSWKRSALSTW